MSDTSYGLEQLEDDLETVRDVWNIAIGDTDDADAALVRIEAYARANAARSERPKDNDKALQDAWAKLQQEKAELYEIDALAIAAGEPDSPERAHRISSIDVALSRLKSARAIRSLLSKIYSVGEL